MWCRCRLARPTRRQRKDGRVSSRLLVYDLGHQPYAEVLELQRTLCRRRQAGELNDDLLLLVEHEPVVTLGRGARAQSMPLSAVELERRGIGVYEVERGGDVTFHGPGQLVGYPILDLRNHREDLHWYLRSLEAALVEALRILDIPAGCRPGLTGVWTGGRKIASIGVHVKQWITYHGFALNVHTDLSYFGLIVPCGIAGVTMTSVAAELGRADMAGLQAQARQAVMEGMSKVFATPVAFGRPIDFSPYYGRLNQAPVT
jgi:lipoate-protein ligase B